MGSFPNVWGKGNIFAFSGFEGKTDWSYPFVGTLLEKRIGFTLRTEREKTFWVALRNGKRIGEIIDARNKNGFEYFSPDVISGDILSLNFGVKNSKIHLLMLPRSKDAIMARIFPLTESIETVAYLVFRVEACKKLFFDDHYFIMKTDKDTTFLLLNQKPNNYCVVDSMEEVGRVISDKAEKRPREWDGDKEVRYLVISQMLKKSKTLDISITTRKRSKKRILNFEGIEKKNENFYIKRLAGFENRTLSKAFSILKANVESPQGVFKQKWSTPDRWPHRHLWLWDSCLHSIGYVFVDKKLAEDSLSSVFDIQQENGFVPHIGRPNGDFSNITQPPLLSWAVLQVYQHTKNKRFLSKYYPKLRKYLLWCIKNRDKNRNGLLEWTRSDESGLDNSSRFNFGCNFDAIDFSSLLVNELFSLHKIGKEIGKKDKMLKNTAEGIAGKIENYLWNKKEEFFFDRYFNGRFSIFKTVCGFLPLFARIANNQQAEKLVHHLKNPNEFYTPLPIPSEAIDSPTFDNNMWRGPIWLNYNYFIIKGLRNYGFFDLAEDIRKKTIKEVERWYRKEGTIFEFYDPFRKRSPKRMPRKDKFGAIKEFGWSAAIYIALSMMSDSS